MTGWLFVLLLVVVGLAYLMIASAASIRLYRLRLEHCSNCREGRSCFDDDVHWIAPVFGGLLWPVALPMVFTAIRADPERTKRQNEALQRRITQLEKEAGLK